VSLLTKEPDEIVLASSLGYSFLGEHWLKVNKKSQGSSTPVIFVKTTIRI
jgi:hypothetical protein